jgi:hypothetical protein
MKFRILPIILLLCACTTNVIQSTPEPTSRVFLPIVQRSNTYPVIYNCQGDVTTEEWLHEYWGDVRWAQGVSSTLTTLWSRCGDQPASVTVYVERGGLLASNVPVRFSWPDGFVVEVTDFRGLVGFGYGGGAYYEVPDGGPHTISLDLPGSVVVSGLGMLRFTNHDHLDLGISLP